MDMQDDNFDPNATAYMQALQSLSKGSQQPTGFGPPQGADQQGVQSAGPDEHPANAPTVPALQGQQAPQQQAAAPQQSQIPAVTPTAKDSSVGNPYFYAAPQDDSSKKQGGSNPMSSIMQFAPLLAMLA